MGMPSGDQKVFFVVRGSSQKRAGRIDQKFKDFGNGTFGRAVFSLEDQDGIRSHGSQGAEQPSDEQVPILLLLQVQQFSQRIQ